MSLRMADSSRSLEALRAVVSALVAMASIAVAQTPAPARLTTIAVMPLQGKGVPATDADVITDAIATQMQQSGNLRVLERAQMDRIMNEQGLAKSGACDGSECAVEMGKLLSVDQILVGSVGLVGHTYTLNLRIVSVQTGEVLKSRMKSNPGTIDDVLTRLVPEAVADLTSAAPAKDRTASGPAKAPAPTAGTAPKSHWGWWLAGGALVAGGAATAVILTSGSGGATNPAPPSSEYNSVNVKW